MKKGEFTANAPEAVSSEEMHTPRYVSVIIPVHNDAERLALCLQALESQSYPRECYEILVVDNGSENSIRSLTERFPKIKTLFERQPGAYAARNTALAEAKGPVLAFTDSDCLPARDWIEKGVGRLQSVPNCGLVGGRIDLFLQNPARPTAVELFDTVVMKFDQCKNIEEHAFSVTANLFTFSRVIKQVGPFDSRLKSRGDCEWGTRVASNGYVLLYADDARVAHPARRSLNELVRRMLRLTGGFEDLSRQNSELLFKRDRQEFSLSLLPSLETFLLVWRAPCLTRSQKLKVTFVGVLVKTVKLAERLRLKLWGESAR